MTYTLRSVPPVVSVDLSAAVRVERIACPRCATVNCARHSASSLTTRAVPAYLRSV